MRKQFAIREKSIISDVESLEKLTKAHYQKQPFKKNSEVRGSLPWCIDPDYVQVTEVDALSVLPVVTGASLGPDVVRMNRLDRRLQMV